MPAATIILGIDPGTNLLGYGVIEIQGSKINYIAMGELKLAKYEDHGQKLHAIFTRVGELVDGFGATVVSIEAPFYGKNVQSMLKLGRAQGVAIAAAISRGLKVYEYEPRKIKQSVVGNGNASKEQVAIMLESILGTKLEYTSLDATDGLAAAVCHHFQFNPKEFGTPKGKGSGWKAFLTNNPDRLK
jgi:crossover junction endodeoxyribonuclease RuvC